MKKIIGLITVLTTVVFFSLSAGKPDPTYAVSFIPAQLKENAHTIIRSSFTKYEVTSDKLATEQVSRVITLMNKKSKANYAGIPYDNFSKVKWIKGKIYDANGKVIKKIKTRFWHKLYKNYQLLEVSQGLRTILSS